MQSFYYTRIKKILKFKVQCMSAVNINCSYCPFIIESCVTNSGQVKNNCSLNLVWTVSLYSILINIWPPHENINC